MRIIGITAALGRDLYGTLLCEHCEATAKLSGGYDDAHWHNNVLPAFHCKKCGKNRAGELSSPEVTARNQTNGINGI